jgi:hypothetical protein
MNTRWIVVAAVVAASLTGAYCAGKSSGERNQKLTTLAAHVDTVTDTIHVVETRLVKDSAAQHAAERAANAQRDTARQALAVTQQAIAYADSTGSTTLPISTVLPGIHACEAALVDDSIAQHATTASLADMTKDRDAWKERALTDEEENKLLAPARFGFKTGMVIGGATVSLLAVLVHAVLH